MEERYNILKQAQMEQFFIDAPVQAVEYQILFDKETGKNIARIKFHNFKAEDVASINYNIVCKNAMGKKVGLIKSAMVLAQNNANADFGIDKTYEVNAETTSISLKVLKVFYTGKKPIVFKNLATIKDKIISEESHEILLERYNLAMKQAVSEYKRKKKKNTITGISVTAAVLVLGAIITFLFSITEQYWAYDFKEVNGGYEISDYKGFVSKVEIPEQHNGKDVISIGDSAFYDCDNLISITIPSGVESIGECAFQSCSNLTSITIPSSVESIGVNPFYGCYNLASIEVEEGNKTYHSTNNCIIETASKTLIVGCKNSIIPSDGSVTSIGDYAFSNCSNLTSITIPSGVESIGNYAFYNCRNLTSITIPSGVEHIGCVAFEYCRKLTSITFEDTSNWYKIYYNNYKAETNWQNKTNGTAVSSSALSDASTNASNFIDYYGYYCTYYWYKEGAE